MGLRVLVFFYECPTIFDSDHTSNDRHLKTNLQARFYRILKLKLKRIQPH